MPHQGPVAVHARQIAANANGPPGRIIQVGQLRVVVPGSTCAAAIRRTDGGGVLHVRGKGH